MKNTILKFSLTALATLTLAACGSSGGGDNSAQPATSAQPTTSAQPATSAQPVTSAEAGKGKDPLSDNYFPSTGQVSGNYLNLPVKEVKSVDITTFSSNEPDEVNKLIVEGKAIDIIPGNLSSGKYILIDTKNDIRLVGGRQNIRWGYVGSSQTTEHYVVAQGTYATSKSDMDKMAGVIQYSGYAAHLYNTVPGHHGVDKVVPGKVDINVDFGTKKLAGKIVATDNYQFGADSVVNLSADVKGNKFEGSLNGTSTEGAFYGKDAAELTGYYVNPDKKYLGVYGASKQ